MDDVFNANDISDIFENMIKNFNKTGWYKEVAGILERSVKKSFQQGSPGRYDPNLWREGRGGSQPWTDLKESTKKARARQGKWPGQILAVTGKLKNSIHASYDNEGVILGVGMTYGKYLNFGTSKMAARPFLVIQDEDYVQIRNIAAKYLGT